MQNIITNMAHYNVLLTEILILFLYQFSSCLTPLISVGLFLILVCEDKIQLRIVLVVSSGIFQHIGNNFHNAAWYFMSIQ